MKKIQFGIRMDGCETEIEKIFVDYLLSNRDNFKYLEIGAAGGLTMRAIFEIVSKNIKHNNWSILGIDIENGWSLDWNKLLSLFGQDDLYVCTNLKSRNESHGRKVELIVDNNPRELVKNHIKDIDICFIDACHCRECPKNDFLNVEENIKKNGIVIFHDSGIIEQGTDWQCHGNSFIEVRRSIADIGLFDDKFKNWRFIKEIYGSRFTGGDGNSCSVFQKI
jgi:hypothetical protein